MVRNISRVWSDIGKYVSIGWETRQWACRKCCMTANLQFSRLAGFGPFSALYFVFYEQFKAISVELTATTSESLSLPYVISSSAAAGALASFLTSPLDMAKLRLQVQRRGGNTTTSYQGIVDCLRQAYHHGGISGLFRGAGARVLHFVPATSKF